MGRGNLAYGAMVGANHTGRVNDQECWAGEGCFFGLGVSVKFPFNMSSSPYSIVAAGTTCPPQKISFPFSLITSPSSTSQVAQVANIITPGWVLWANPYLVERAAMKFFSRRSAQNHKTDFGVIRPSIIEMSRRARNRLRKFTIDDPGPDDFLTEAEIPELGKNLMRTSDVARAVGAYTDFIRMYALHGLLTAMTKAMQKAGLHHHHHHGVRNSESDNKTAACITTLSDDQLVVADLYLFNSEEENKYLLWAQQKSLLKEEYPEIDIETCISSGEKSTLMKLRPLLDDFVILEERYATAIEASKNRDTERGREIIPGYEMVNKMCTAEDCSDDVIRKAKGRTDMTKKGVALIDQILSVMV